MGMFRVEKSYVQDPSAAVGMTEKQVARYEGKLDRGKKDRTIIRRRGWRRKFLRREKHDAKDDNIRRGWSRW